MVTGCDLAPAFSGFVSSGLAAEDDSEDEIEEDGMELLLLPLATAELDGRALDEADDGTAEELAMALLLATEALPDEAAADDEEATGLGWYEQLYGKRA